MVDPFGNLLQNINLLGNVLTQSAFRATLSVNQITTPALRGVHGGTGTFPKTSWEVIDPASIPGPPSVQLRKSAVTADVRCYFFESRDVSMLPSHFAAAASSGLDDFSNVNIFFHPNPAHADPPMLPQDYPDQGSWASLFRYAFFNGTQLSASGKKQIFIMPYVPARMFGDAGQFSTHWRAISTDIAKLVKLDITGAIDPMLEIKNVVVSSFSFGIQASDGFRTKAGSALAPLLREIWDLDGMFSSVKSISIQLRNKQLPKLIQHQQDLATLSNSFLVGPARWQAIKPDILKIAPLAAGKFVHRTIGKHMYFHACSKSTVG